MVRGPDRARGMQKIDREDFYVPSRLSTTLRCKDTNENQNRIRDLLFLTPTHLPTSHQTKLSKQHQKLLLIVDFASQILPLLPFGKHFNYCSIPAILVAKKQTTTITIISISYSSSSIMPPNVLPWEFINDNNNNNNDISRYHRRHHHHHRNNKYDDVNDDDSDLSSEIDQNFTSSKQSIDNDDNRGSNNSNNNSNFDGKRLWEKLLTKEKVVNEQQQEELFKALSSIIVLDDDDDDDDDSEDTITNKEWLKRFHGQLCDVSLNLIEGLRYVIFLT